MLTHNQRCNAAIFEAIDSNDYDVLIVTEPFLSGARYDQNMTHYCVNETLLPRETVLQIGGGPTYPASVSDDAYVQPLGSPSSRKGPDFNKYFLPHVQSLQSSAAQLKRLSNEECIHKYSTRILTGNRNLLAVTSSESTVNATIQNEVRNGSLLFIKSVGTNEYTQSYPTHYEPFDYICSGLDGYLDGRSDRCSPEMINPATWNIFGFPIEYCLSEIVEEQYRLQFSPVIGIVIVTCNAIKVCCMLYAALKLKSEALCTQG